MIRFQSFFIFFLILGTCEAEQWNVEGKVGAFVPQSDRLRDIFHDAMPMVEIEVNYKSVPQWSHWVSLNCIFDVGNSIGCGNKTTIQVTSLMSGINRYFYLTPDNEGFLGLGGLLSLYTNRDHSEFVHKNISAYALGAIIKAGLNTRLSYRTTLSLFAQYFFQQFSFDKIYVNHFTYRNDVNMNGLGLGAGLVYRF